MSVLAVVVGSAAKLWQVNSRTQLTVSYALAGQNASVLVPTSDLCQPTSSHDQKTRQMMQPQQPRRRQVAAGCRQAAEYGLQPLSNLAMPASWPRLQAAPPSPAGPGRHPGVPLVPVGANLAALVKRQARPVLAWMAGHAWVPSLGDVP